MIIDTHVHVWDLDKAEYPWLKGDTSLLNRTWRIEQLEDERKKTGVTKGVLVQAAGNFEDTENMLAEAKKATWIEGIVAWAPLMDTNATKKFIEERYKKENYFKGIRHQVHDESNAKWLLQPAVIESLKILAANNIPYDIVGIVPEHIRTVIEVTEKIPGLRMVLDHLNQPPIATKEKFGEWGELMREAAKHKNIYAKISGLGTATKNFTGWEADDIKPYVAFVIEQFGTDRCFCGGDWPVSLLAGSYSATWKIYQQVINELTNESQKIFYKNAQAFYDLQ